MTGRTLAPMSFSLLGRLDSRWIAGVASVVAAGPAHVLFREVGQRVLPFDTRQLGARMATQVAAQVGLAAPLEVQALASLVGRS